jgi:hypothetical protein
MLINKKSASARRMKKTTQLVVATGNPVLDRKIEMAMEGLAPHTRRQLFNEFSVDNRTLLVEFLNDFVSRENISLNSKKVYVCNLLYLLRVLKHKSLKEVTRDDILAYLSTLRRTTEKDPFQKWINTHNNRAVIYQKFFKWLYSPTLPARDRPVPEVVRDLPLIKRKEKTHVQAVDLWTPEDDALFLRYCSDPRISLYHMMSRDTSARPHEILVVKNGDIKIKTAGNKTYAEVEVGRGGKTKSRTVPLIASLPYYKALMQTHPEPNNHKSYVFRSNTSKSRYHNVSLTPHSIHTMYWNLKHDIFPKLLDRPDISPEEKLKIRDLLAKPWNPYIRRHTSLTEKAKLVNEYTLRLHAGWSKTSKMVEIYTHELGGESSAMLLSAYGILPQASDSKNMLFPKQCPSCNEPNKPDALYCVKSGCGYPLNVQAYEEIKSREQEKEKEAAETKAKLDAVYKALYERGIIKKG